MKIDRDEPPVSRKTKTRTRIRSRVRLLPCQTAWSLILLLDYLILTAEVTVFIFLKNSSQHEQLHL